MDARTYIYISLRTQSRPSYSRSYTHAHRIYRYNILCECGLVFFPLLYITKAGRSRNENQSGHRVFKIWVRFGAHENSCYSICTHKEYRRQTQRARRNDWRNTCFLNRLNFILKQFQAYQKNIYYISVVYTHNAYYKRHKLFAMERACVLLCAEEKICVCIRLMDVFYSIRFDNPWPTTGVRVNGKKVMRCSC